MSLELTTANEGAMQRDKKPVYEKITFPKVPNYNNVREYLFSKAATEGIAKKFENGDNIERSVEISHYLAQKDLVQTNKRLEDTKKSSQEKRHSMNEQWADLRRKEESLRENFINFDEFVKENQEKRERAANKVIDQEALYEQRRKNVEELSKKCDEITEVKKMMDRTISEYRIYENYLKEVISNEPSMQNVADLLKRYEALLSARQELNEMQQRDMLKLERAKTNLEKLTANYYIKIDYLKTRLATLGSRYEEACHKSSNWEILHDKIKGRTCEQVQEIMKLVEEKNFVIMGLNNQIANLQERYENANIKALESENLVTQIKNNAVKKMNEIDEVKFAIWNIYNHMCVSKLQSVKIKRANVEEQIMYINRTLSEMVKVNKILKRKAFKK